MVRSHAYAFTLHPPDRLTCDGRTADVCATVYRALAYLAANNGRTIFR